MLTAKAPVVVGESLVKDFHAPSHKEKVSCGSDKAKLFFFRFNFELVNNT